MKCINKECPCGFWENSGCSGNCKYVPRGELCLCKSYKPEQDELEEILDNAIAIELDIDGNELAHHVTTKLKTLLSIIIDRIKKLEKDNA